MVGRRMENLVPFVLSCDFEQVVVKRYDVLYLSRIFRTLHDIESWTKKESEMEGWENREGRRTCRERMIEILFLTSPSILLLLKQTHERWLDIKVRERDTFFKSIPSTLCFKVNQVNNWRRKKAKEKRRKNLKTREKKRITRKEKRIEDWKCIKNLCLSQNVTWNLKS